MPRPAPRVAPATTATLPVKAPVAIPRQRAPSYSQSEKADPAMASIARNPSLFACAEAILKLVS